jgi:hypothetical protein
MNRLILYGWGFKAPISKKELRAIKYFKRLNLRKSIEYKNEEYD